jgi:proline dehydrogenase
MRSPQPALAPGLPTFAPVPGLNFDDTEVAFRYKSDADIRKGLLLFRSIQYPFLVKTGPRLVNFSLRIGLPIKGLLRKYFFNQFCGGVNFAEAQQTINRLHQHGVLTVLDYAVEGEKTEPGFDAVLDELLRLLQFANTSPAVPFVAAKLTGLGPADVMTKLQAGQPLTPDDEARYQKLLQRVEQLCATAHQLGQALYIDAEETWFQDVVDRITEDMMLKYNRERPIVYTTVQMYRHDRLAYLEAFSERMAAGGAIPAVKLVRGAYLEKENARAAEKGYPTPMQPSKAATDADFNRALHFILQRIDRYGLCIGSHNEASSRFAAEYLEAHGLPRNHPNVFFAQLYGMSDTLTFNLAHAGYNAAKYLPYGPVEAAVPYLFRRANENSSVNSQSNRELDLLRREQARRCKAKAR